MLSAVPCRPTALLVRLTFKESWEADNNPTTSRCDKTFRWVADRFDTALVILAGVALRKQKHTQHRARAITITYHLNTALFIYSRVFHYYFRKRPFFARDFMEMFRCLLLSSSYQFEVSSHVSVFFFFLNICITR